MSSRLYLKGTPRDFPGKLVIKTSPSNAGGVGSIFGWGDKIPHGSWPKNQNIKKRSNIVTSSTCVCSVAQLCPTLCGSNFLQLSGLFPTRLLCPCNFPGKNTGEGCHFLLQGTLPDPEMEPEYLASPALEGGFFTTSATWETNLIKTLKMVHNFLKKILFF